jgi:hypothetical protein
MCSKEQKLADIAAIISGSIGTSCCFKTGGRGGKQMSDACECRYLAKQILEVIEKQ